MPQAEEIAGIAAFPGAREIEASQLGPVAGTVRIALRAAPVKRNVLLSDLGVTADFRSRGCAGGASHGHDAAE